MFKKSILTVLLIAIGLCTAGSAYGAPSGLLAHWPLDEGEGTVAADISGNGLDGTLEGDATWITDGVIDGALHLVRAGDREGGQCS